MKDVSHVAKNTTYKLRLKPEEIKKKKNPLMR